MPLPVASIDEGITMTANPPPPPPQWNNQPQMHPPPPQLNGVPPAPQSPRPNKPKIIIGITACLIVIVFAVIAIPKLLHNGGPNDPANARPVDLQASPNWLKPPAVAWQLNGLEGFYTGSPGKYLTVLRGGETQVIDAETGEVKLSFDCGEAEIGDIQQIGDIAVLCYNDSPGMGAYDLETGEHHVSAEFREVARLRGLRGWETQGSAISRVQYPDDAGASTIEWYDPKTAKLQHHCEVPGVIEWDEGESFGFWPHPSGTAALFFRSWSLVQFIDLETCEITDLHVTDIAADLHDAVFDRFSTLPTSDGWWTQVRDAENDSYYGVHISLQGRAEQLGTTTNVYWALPVGSFLGVMTAFEDGSSVTAADLQHFFEIPSGDVQDVLYGSLGDKTYVAARIEGDSESVKRHYLDGNELSWPDADTNAILFVDEHHALVFDKETKRLDLIGEGESEPLWTIPRVEAFGLADDKIIVFEREEERSEGERERIAIRAYTAATD